MQVHRMTEAEFLRLAYLCQACDLYFPHNLEIRGKLRQNFWNYINETRYQLWSAIEPSMPNIPVGMCIVARDRFPFENIQQHHRIILLLAHPNYEAAGERLLDAVVKSAILEDVHTIGADLDAKWDGLLDKMLFPPQTERVLRVRRLPASDYPHLGREHSEWHRKMRTGQRKRDDEE